MLTSPRKLKGRNGRRAETWNFLLLLLLRSHLSKEERWWAFPESTGGRRVGSAHRPACRRAQGWQPFSGSTRLLLEAIKLPPQAHAVTSPIEQKRKARPRKAKWLLPLRQWVTGQISLALQVLALLIRSPLKAFINVSVNLIFMHWISKISSPPVMQNHPEMFHALLISQKLSFLSAFGLWWSWSFTSSKNLLMAIILKSVMSASFAGQADRKPFFKYPDCRDLRWWLKEFATGNNFLRSGDVIKSSLKRCGQ